MKSLYAAVVMTVCLAGQSASACFFFPCMSMPFAGYSPWGAGYAPANYGYASAGYGGNCCQTGYGVYSASYQGYANTGCNSCGNNCGGTCRSTFSQTLNYGGGCTNCGSDCIGTESRKIPEADSEYNKDAPIRKYGPDDELDKEDGFGASDRSQPDRGSGSGYETDAERRLRLDRERQERLERDRQDLSDPNRGSSGRWSPSDSDPADRNRFDRPSTPGALDEGLSRPNPIDDTPFPEPFEGFGGGNKPPMTDPADVMPPVDQSVRKPAMPPIEEGVEAEAGVDEEEDFLPPEPAADARTSHADVLKMPRLAGRTRTRTQATSKVSSSQSKQTPARWISLPLPAGRARS